MKTVVVAHLFYEDIAVEVIERLAGLGGRHAIVVTGPAPSRLVRRAFARLPRAEWVETPDLGQDVAPFLSLLPALSADGCQLVCKVHTKRGDIALGRRWRQICLDALTSPDRIEATLDAFARRPSLAMVGPEELYLSAAINMLGNADAVRRIGARLWPGLALPEDWGFFAGTMFWARLGPLLPFAALVGDGLAWGEGNPVRDGGVAHAVERLLGLAPAAAKGRIGLIGPASLMPRPADRTGAPLDINQALARVGLVRSAPASDAAIPAGNPLLHYLTATPGLRCDPHPLFADAWYAARNGLAAEETPLAHFLAAGADAPDPSPLFAMGIYYGRRGWLRRRDRNALLHYVLHAPSGDDGKRPHIAATDGFSRAGRRRQLAGFLERGAMRRFAIKSAAPVGSGSGWGDRNFADGLAAALRAAGHEARVDLRDDWYRADEPVDVVICLRGPAAYRPRPDSLNILWVISHPDQVGFDEADAFDLVYVASAGFARLLAHCVDVPVRPLLQATDPERFRPQGDGRLVPRLFFAGNSRGQDRPVLRWAMELGLPLEIYGNGWTGVADPAIVKGRQIDNAALPARYGSAIAVLNDHWAAMRDFGIVSNRLLDVIAAGGTPVTDAFSAVGAMLGKAAIQVGGREGLEPAIVKAARRSARVRRAYARSVAGRHAFAHRAAEILADIDALRRSGRRRPTRQLPGIHIVFDGGDAAAAWVVSRRLLGPLTSDEAGLATVTFGSAGERVPPAVAVVAVPGPSWSLADTVRLLAARDPAAPLVVDLGALPGRAGLGAAIRPLAAAAGQLWTPGPGWAPGAPRRKTHIVPESIDPRLWRDHHRGRSEDGPDEPRFVVLALDGIGPAVADRLRAALSGLTSEVTIVSRAMLQDLPWPVVVPPAGRNAYASFARWFREQRFAGCLCLDLGGPVGSALEAEFSFLAAAAAGLVPVGDAGALPDPGIASRGLMVPAAGDWGDLSAAADRVAASPRRFAAVAAAAADYVWSERSAAAVGGQIRSALGLGRHRGRRSRATGSLPANLG